MVVNQRYQSLATELGVGSATLRKRMGKGGRVEVDLGRGNRGKRVRVEVDLGCGNMGKGEGGVLREF